MLPQLTEFKAIATEKELAKTSHALMVLPFAKKLGRDPQIPFLDTLLTALKRKHGDAADLAKGPITTESPTGGLLAWVMLDGDKSRFEQHTTLRKGVMALLGENPKELAIAVFGDGQQRALAAELATYVALVNGAELPSRKKKDKTGRLTKVAVHGHAASSKHINVRSVVEGNSLTRELTMLPPNELTPGLYRQRVKKLARDNGWKLEELDLKKLKKMGAGAFCAVAQGSEEQDAAVVHLTYAPKGAKKTIALVGKGICFDTGGHNLKPARYMHGMHKDMNGSAVALGILLAATRLKLPVRIDAWLALAQNHISPTAYKQNDVVTALNGTTIEIMHTDAEGRMVLADTLTLATRAKPDAMIDFATLTGSMKVALGNRYSGILSNSGALLDAAIAAGHATGERVCAFPLDADYEAALDSKIADIKQCTLDGDADHILAARFLMRFIEERPWLHMDLSADDCEGGLGALASEVTGFGVAWGVELLRTWR
jgi:leucyl aminopeptidase